MALSRTVSEIDGDFSRKSQNFPTNCILRPRWRVRLGIGYRRSGWKKTRIIGLPGEKKVWRCLQPSGYNTPTWQTDGDIERQQRPRLRTASRDKKTIVV